MLITLSFETEFEVKDVLSIIVEVISVLLIVK